MSKTGPFKKALKAESDNPGVGSSAFGERTLPQFHELPVPRPPPHARHPANPHGHVRTIRDRLGHRSIRITYDWYGRYFEAPMRTG